MKFFAHIAGLLLLGAASAAQAGSLYTSVGGTGGVFLDLGPGATFDINGNAAFLTAGLPGNPVLLLDISPPLVHPGNLTLIATDLAVDQLELSIFDLAHATIVGTDVFLPGTVAAITGITDPGLAGLLGPVRFDFKFVRSGDGLTTFQLSSIATGVPEPSTIALTALGLAFAVGSRRRVSSRKRS